MTRFPSLVLLLSLTACAIDDPAVDETEQASLVGLGATPATPGVGFYCSAVQPSHGWNLIIGSANNPDANPCASIANGATQVHTGMYAVNAYNAVEAWCAPNVYFLRVGVGASPLSAAYNDVVNSTNNGDCVFHVTANSTTPRGPAANNHLGTALPDHGAVPAPGNTTSWYLDLNRFTTKVNTLLSISPMPVGYQLTVRNQGGLLLYSKAFGSASGNISTDFYPTTAMTTGRRFDLASVSKAITATAMMAAIEDAGVTRANDQPLGISLDSSIAPYLPSNWDRSKVGNTTFRQVLRHESGLCTTNTSADLYAQVKAIVEAGPIAPVGQPIYCDANYTLLRVLIAYVVDGPAAFANSEILGDNDAVTAQSYRNFVRGRVLGPIGLSAVDTFYTGALPETAYFSFDKLVPHAMVGIPDKLNVPPIPGSSATYDQRANTMVLTVGSGMWTMSAEELGLFVTSLWRNKIVSAAGVADMLPRKDDPNFDYGFGMFYTTFNSDDGTQQNSIDISGGGWAGGSVAEWMTLGTGMTVTFTSNSTFPSSWGGVAPMLHAAAASSLIPTSWTCPATWYDSNDGCDLNCGAADPDCL